MEIGGDVTDAGRTTSKDRATQLLICEPLSFAIITKANWNLCENVEDDFQGWRCSIFCLFSQVVSDT